MFKKNVQLKEYLMKKTFISVLCVLAVLALMSGCKPTTKNEIQYWENNKVEYNDAVTTYPVFEPYLLVKKNEAEKIWEEALEDQYQPQLKKGINLDVKFKPVKEDEKDGDMDIRVTIKPNDTDESFTLNGQGDVADIPVKEKDLLKAKYDKGKFLADVTKIDKKKKEETHKFRYTKLTKDTENNTFAEFKKKWDKGDIEKVNNERQQLIQNRPSHKSDFRDNVWKTAPKEYDNNGVEFVRDPNIRTIKLYKNKPWDAGHKKDHKYSVLVDEYIDGDIDWDEFLVEYHRKVIITQKIPTKIEAINMNKNNLL
jgi:hypothetical protein